MFYKIEDTALTAIGNAIRSKTGGEDLLTPAEMVTAIEGIHLPSVMTLSVSENGTYTPEEGIDGFNEVTVDVQPSLQSLSVSENGTYSVPEGYYGYSDVFVNV